MSNKLHHLQVIEEYGVKPKDKNKKNTLFQVAGIELVERGNKKFIKIDISKFGQYFPAEFRKIIENPSIREIEELKNRVVDFENKKYSNPLEKVPVRLAFSTFPLTYIGNNSKIISLIEAGNLSFKEILENSNEFLIDLTINNNPNGFFGSLTPINAKLIDSVGKASEILLKEQINKILKGTNASMVKSTNDIGLIISDGINEQIISGYNYTFDKQVSGIEMGKTTIRTSGKLILDDLEDWKKERINITINLQTLIDYFNNYYTTSNNKNLNLVESIYPTLKIISPTKQIKLGNFFVGNNKIKSESDLKRIISKYRTKDKEKYKQYLKFEKKLIFNPDGSISILAKDLNLTPPLVLWLEKLLKENGENNQKSFGTTLTNKMTEIEKISNNFENIMFEVLRKKGEDKLVYFKKNNKQKFGKPKVKTPDYIEQINNKEIIIYDFKISQTTTSYDDFTDTSKYKLLYKNKNVTAKKVQIICLDKKTAQNNQNCIYFRNFIQQKNIKISNKQKQKIDKIEADYLFFKQILKTNTKAQKILQ